VVHLPRSHNLNSKFWCAEFVWCAVFALSSIGLIFSKNKTKTTRHTVSFLNATRFYLLSKQVLLSVFGILATITLSISRSLNARSRGIEVVYLH